MAITGTLLQGEHRIHNKRVVIEVQQKIGTLLLYNIPLMMHVLNNNEINGM